MAKGQGRGCRAAFPFPSAAFLYMRQLGFPSTTLTSPGYSHFCDMPGDGSGGFQQGIVSRLKDGRKVWLMLKISRQLLLLAANSFYHWCSPCFSWHASHVCVAWEFSGSCFISSSLKLYYFQTILLVAGT